MYLYQTLLTKRGSNNPINIGLIGAGKFGTMFLSQVVVIPGMNVVAIADLNPSDAKADIVVLCTAHPEVLALDWEELLSVSRVGLFFDGRRVLNSSELTKIGWTFSGIGLP